MNQPKKIKLQKRTRSAARIHKGLSMPVGSADEDSIISFRDFGELKEKYFRFSGTLQRQPFVLRTLVLMFGQAFFSLILYSRLVEALLIGRIDLALLFAVIFLALTVPVVWAQISVGSRRLRDMGRSGWLFAVPFSSYSCCYILPVLGAAAYWQFTAAATVVLYFLLALVKGTAAAEPRRR
ncbi:DUF805 domain-containing protein [Megasphaera vaginalis (ex Bordigoni et al. 2020)]|uniref:DUF805 domain-containing protein n=1 Tax=Megasphaera vaginalis (ex Bordigoni et al. 2020) TaxID=2045301 RepID=UPI000C7DEF3A|nr:DUF805 domain-containing protein [Megasphaera vaginalis (ex Bordigoni et al. 2020)]